MTKRDRALSHTVRFLAFQRAQGAIAPPTPPLTRNYAPILEVFASWILRHRGVAAQPLRRYRCALDIFVAALYEDPSRYDAKRIRTLFLQELCSSRSHTHC